MNAPLIGLRPPATLTCTVAPTGCPWRQRAANSMSGMRAPSSITVPKRRAARVALAHRLLHRPVAQVVDLAHLARGLGRGLVDRAVDRPVGGDRHRVRGLRAELGGDALDVERTSRRTPLISGSPRRRLQPLAVERPQAAELERRQVDVVQTSVRVDLGVRDRVRAEAVGAARRRRARRTCPRGTRRPRGIPARPARPSRAGRRARPLRGARARSCRRAGAARASLVRRERYEALADRGKKFARVLMKSATCSRM
jgi:hypothetical protein